MAEALSVDELQKRTIDGMRRTKERKLETVDIKAFCSETLTTLKSKKDQGFTEKERQDLVLKIELLYHAYVTSQHIQEEERVMPYAETLKAISMAEIVQADEEQGAEA